MIEDGVELLIGERIGDVLNECKSRKEAHFREEQKLLVSCQIPENARRHGVWL